MYPYVKNNKTVSIIVDGELYTINDMYISYNTIMDFITNNDVSKDNDKILLKYLSPIEAFKNIVLGNTSFSFEDNELVCKVDKEVIKLPEDLYRDIYKIYEEEGSLLPLLKFVKKLLKNPRKEVVEELWSFIKVCGFSLTSSGNFLAYKRVTDDFKDIFTKTIDNSPGTVVKMLRNQVEYNPNITCASGLHFAAWEYLDHYAKGGRTVLVSVSPKNVVSIPSDYNNMKGRACKYKIIKEVHTPKELDTKKYYSEPDYTDTDIAIVK